MEPHKLQLRDEEEEEDVALLRRKSRHFNGTPSAPAPVNNHTNGEANGGTEHASEPENKELNSNGNKGYDVDVAAVAEENEDEATRLLKNGVYFDGQQGNGAGHGLSGMKYDGDESSVSETNPKDEELDMKVKDFHIQRIISTEFTHQHGENLEDEIFSSSSLPPVQSLCEEKSKNLEHLDNKTGVDADIDVIEENIDVIEEIDQEYTEIDVERVLQKQNTHDLYCPNCNSCITRRVILCRKKRKARNLRHRPKHDKIETRSVVDADLVSATNDQGDTLNSCSTNSPLPAADGDNHDRQPDAFRCLSCFSLFIPKGNGFRLFRVFGDSNENEKKKEVQNIPTSKTNWFFSIFSSGSTKATLDQGNRALEHLEVDATNQHYSFSYSDDTLSCHGSDNPIAPVDDRNPVKTVVPEEDSLISSQQGGLDFLDHSKQRSLLLEKPLMAIDQKANIATGNKTIADQNGRDLLNRGASSQIESFCNAGLFSSASIGSKVTVTSSAEELTPSNNVSSDVVEKSDDAVVKNNTGDDVIVIIEAHSRVHNVDNSSEAGVFPQSGTQMHSSQHAGLEADGAHQLDILKSIVYGGLVESITSLCVVSSAAAAGAATLNILALGLANLIGGLLIIGHNLGELRTDRSEAQTNEQEDRYQQLLGQRDKFSLHATVVVLSFLIFGLVPPVIYGVSFRRSNDRDLKLAAVAGSSIACIILLAIGKGHVQKPPKSYIRTVLYYVSLGVMASAASYVVGDLIKKLLDKLNVFESSVDVNIPFSERNLMSPEWVSY